MAVLLICNPPATKPTNRQFQCVQGAGHKQDKLTKSKRNLAHHPVVATVQTDAPDNQTNGSQHSSGIDEPQAHLWRLLVVVGLGELDDEPVAQAARAENFRNEGTDDQANAEKPVIWKSAHNVCSSWYMGTNAYP